MSCLILAICLAWPTATHGQDESDGAAQDEVDKVVALEIEIDRLTDEVARKQERLVELKRQHRLLKAAEAEGDEPAPEGPPGAPESVAYVLDLNGSMDTKWPLVREEVTKAVGNLGPDTTFDVVLSAEENAEPFHSRPVPATLDAVAALHQFLQGRRTEGPTGMIAAMEAALAHEPDVIWLVTDGDMPDNRRFLERVRKANPGRRTRVNVVVATDGRRLPDTDRIQMVEFLMKVAAENGGKLYGMNGDVVELEALPDWQPQPVDGWRDDQPPRFDRKKIPTGPSIFRE